jgi:hypothetical protein
MTEEERRRLTDNQIIEEMATHDQRQRYADRLIEQNTRDLAIIADRLSESKDDRDSIKAEIEKTRRETKLQLASLGRCVDDLKVWQDTYDSEREQEIAENSQREEKHDAIYAEIVAEFQFRRRLAKWRNGTLLTIGALFGALVSGFALLGHIKDLLQHQHP